MDEKYLNHKNDQVDYPSQQTLPTLEQWRKFETNRLLLEPRTKVTAIVFSSLSIATLVPYVPLLYVCIWAVIIFSAESWMRHLAFLYQANLQNKPSLKTMTVPLSKIARQFKTAWMLNCLAWSGLSLLSQLWLPLYLRLLCIALLNALMFVSVTRSYVDRRLMHKISAAIIISQMLFNLLRLVIKTDDPDVVVQATVFLAYLLSMSYILWSVGNRFNRAHEMRINSEYEKSVMIENLSNTQAQLHLEQQALVASNKLVQQFYSGAAHDLRQPVYAMQLYTSMLSDDPSLAKALLPKITQSCISINDMFNTLFDYQQTHMNDTELVEKDICIREVFKSLALHFEPIATGKGLTIRFKPIMGTVNMVPLYLTRILSNLIANALRYTDTGGVLIAVRKTTTGARAGLRFEIWDTGIGIEDSKLKNIFNEFYKINKLDIKNDGLGLGLSIVKQLSLRVEGTDIDVKSRVGRGSVFTFAVPLERFKL